MAVSGHALSIISQAVWWRIVVSMSLHTLGVKQAVDPGISRQYPLGG